MSGADRTVARRHLRAVTPSQVEAMRATDPADLSALLTAVRVAASGHDSDVVEHASVTVASFWSGGGAADTLHAARAAVRAAVRTVALARQVEGWDLYGDMTEEVTASWESADVRTTLSQWGTAPADALARTTPADVVDYAVGTVTGARRVSLARAVADMRAHDADTCPDCHAGAGRRVSLTGVTAHREGWTGADSRYHAARRHTVAALAEVSRERVLSDLDGAPFADRPRHSRVTGGDRTPRTPAPVGVITVRTRDGAVTVRNMTGAESATVAAPAPAREEARHAGEQYGVTTAPAPDGDRTESGMVRAFKPVVSPRKKSGSGSTGPTVTAW